ncbi:sugar transferase [Kineosporia sp. A_224]|uniref:sugar transferase n=1 Tax=Kineosporia sp. A_224 TaxID=1962180 RepID=UPI000B4B78DD|nr:sugar transferase [Kineosporia sp. A_224]
MTTSRGDLVSLETEQDVTLSAESVSQGAQDGTRGAAGPRAEPVWRRTLVEVTARTTGRSDEASRIVARYRAAALALDATAALLASAAVAGARFSGRIGLGYLALCAVLPLVWVAVLAWNRAYEPRFLGTGTEEYRRILTGGFVLFTVLTVASFSLRAELSRLYVGGVVPLTLALTMLSRHTLRGWLFRLRRQGRAMQHVLVVGRADAAVAVADKLRNEPQHGLVVVGACVPAVEVHVSHVADVPVVGDLGRILEAVDELGVHVVAVVSHPDLSGHALRRLAWALEERDVELVVSPGIVEVAGPRLTIRPVAGLSLLHLERPAFAGGRRVLKVLVDAVLGTALLVLAAPAMLAVAVAVKLDSPGPVLFRQTRVGAAGRPFTMLKFRSMVVDAEERKAGLVHLNEGGEMLFKVRADPRVTRVGAFIRRFSLDELPQLVNVVRGDMSLVGPRPPLPCEVERYDHDATRRLRVRPGVTGLWQVSGRSDLSWEESVLLDLRYVDNWSLALDAVILWRTARAVLRPQGAY